MEEYRYVSYTVDGRREYTGFRKRLSDKMRKAG